jgi:hypothetical protein
MIACSEMTCQFVTARRDFVDRGCRWRMGRIVEAPTSDECCSCTHHPLAVNVVHIAARRLDGSDSVIML